jgi:hypothetical protein
MKVQDWIFSVRYMTGSRYAVVGPARFSTVETALHLAAMPEDVRASLRGCTLVRDFVEGRLDPERGGYHAYFGADDRTSWTICIGSVQEVLR